MVHRELTFCPERRGRRGSLLDACETTTTRSEQQATTGKATFRRQQYLGTRRLRSNKTQPCSASMSTRGYRPPTMNSAPFHPPPDYHRTTRDRENENAAKPFITPPPSSCRRPHTCRSLRSTQKLLPYSPAGVSKTPQPITHTTYPTRSGKTKYFRSFWRDCFCPNQHDDPSMSGT